MPLARCDKQTATEIQRDWHDLVQGDVSAFLRLVMTISRLAHPIMAARGLSNAVKEDVVQEFCSELTACLGRGKDAFSGDHKQRMLRTLIDKAVQRVLRFQMRQIADTLDEAPGAAVHPDLLERVSSEELAKKLRAHLSEREFKVVWDSVVLGVSHRRTAQLVYGSREDKQAHAVAQVLHKATRKLRSPAFRRWLQGKRPEDE